MSRDFNKEQSSGASYSNGQTGPVVDLGLAQQALMAQFASTAHLGAIMSQVADQLDVGRRQEFETREAQAIERHQQQMSTFKDFNDSMLILFESFGEFNRGITQLVAEMRATRGMIDLHNHRLKVLQDQGLGAAEIAEDFPMVPPPKVSLIVAPAPVIEPQPAPAPPVKVKQKRQWSSPEARERVSQAAIATQARRRAEREQRQAEELDAERRAEME